MSKESAEHFNRMLSERAQEIQEMKKQLAEKQQELANAEKQISSTAQKSYLETSELKALLAEKDTLIDVRSSGLILLLKCTSVKILAMRH